MDFALEIATGREALAWLADGDFLRAWARLADCDPKQTIYQEPPFATTWYRVHDGVFEPLLLLATTRPGGELVGMMPLARHLREGRLIHAGDFHAQYKGWVARPEIDEIFPVECLLALRERFPLATWEWGWLPPGAPTGFLDSPRLAEKGIYVRRAIQAAPLWDLGDGERLALLLKNKAIRNKFNRYVKKDNFRLERVRDKERTARLLATLAGQCDFRKEVMHHCRPFADNPHKLPFFAERQDFPEANHFTVLWAGDKPLAFQYGACDGKTLIMGLTAYDPTQARNSPGLLHLVELARLLEREGVRMIDLTPGGDQYKEFFANASWPAVAPTFYFSRGGALRADLMRVGRRSAKKMIGFVGPRPEMVRRGLEAGARLACRIKAAPLRDLPGLLGRLIYEKQTITFYRLNDEATGRRLNSNMRQDSAAPLIRVQHYEDLLGLECSLTAPRRDLLAEAMHRFYAGQTLYSALADGEVAHHGWLTREGAGRGNGMRGGGREFPEEAALLDGFRYHKQKSNGVNLVWAMVGKMMEDLKAAGVREMLIAVERGNRPLEAFVREAGCPPVRVQVRRRLLWRRWEKGVKPEG